MKNLQIYERVMGRLLRESEGEDLAAQVNDTGTAASAIIYDAGRMGEVIRTIHRIAAMGWTRTDPIRDAIVGYISVAQPREKDGPCADAWEIQGAWGPGRGKLIYSVAHALSPSGIIMPDRMGVSAPARRGWKRQGEKGRSFVQLDSIVAHRKGEPHPNHTEDPNDDCHTHGIDYLDRAYAPQGGEDELLRSLRARDRELFKGLTGELEKRLRMEIQLLGAERFGEGL